jgi:hypothetical protein
VPKVTVSDEPLEELEEIVLCEIRIPVLDIGPDTLASSHEGECIIAV